MFTQKEGNQSCQANCESPISANNDLYRRSKKCQEMTKNRQDRPFMQRKQTENASVLEA